MMDCEQIQKILPAFLEGVLPAQQEGLIRDHLAACPQCGKILAYFKKSGELLSHLKEVEPPPWFTQKVMARVREEAERKKSGVFSRLFYPLHVKVPIQALATVLIVVLALYVYRTVEPEMKVGQAPSDTARSISRDAVQMPYGEAGAPPLAREGKATAKKQREKDLNSVSLSSQALEPKTIAGEQAEKDKPTLSGESGKVALKEDKLQPSKPAEERISPKQQGALAEKQEQDMRVAAAPPSHTEAPQLQTAPASAPRQAESAASAGSKVTQQQERKAASAPRAMKASAPKIPEPISLTLRVNDVAAAAIEIRNILGQLGARDIVRQPREDGEVIAAHLKTEKAKDLYDKLSAMGQINEKGARGARSEISTEDVAIKIEIIGNH